MSEQTRPLSSITAREASIFACLVDSYVEPEAPFPAVRDTQAVPFMDTWLARAPTFNRRGIRALLYLCELAPLLGKERRRFRRLSREQRVAFLRRVDTHPWPPIRSIGHLGKLTANLGYYGDRSVMLVCGYDPAEKIADARALRQREGRP